MVAASDVSTEGKEILPLASIQKQPKGAQCSSTLGFLVASSLCKLAAIHNPSPITQAGLSANNSRCGRSPGSFDDCASADHHSACLPGGIHRLVLPVHCNWAVPHLPAESHNGPWCGNLQQSRLWDNNYSGPVFLGASPWLPAPLERCEA